MWHLAEFLQLLVGVGVQLLGHVLHPQQGAAVLGASLLHAAHRQQCVGDGAPPERLHLLVQAVQRSAQRHPVVARCRTEGLFFSIISVSKCRSASSYDSWERRQHPWCNKPACLPAFLPPTSAWPRCTGPCWWRPSCCRPWSGRARPGSGGRGRARSPPGTSLRGREKQTKKHLRRRANC